MHQTKIATVMSLMIATLPLATHALMPKAIDDPHFYLVMENQSAQDVTMSFQPVVGNVSLDPVLPDHTALAAGKDSAKYGVIFQPLDPSDTFNVVFTGAQDCTFNVAFFAPGDPKITVSGLGCAGGGYKIIGGDTLMLYISDIHLKHA